MISTTCSTVGDIQGKLIEGIAEDVPSIEPSVSLQEALKTAVVNERDDIKDVAFNSDEDGRLIIYVQVLLVDICGILQTVIGNFYLYLYISAKKPVAGIGN